MLFRSSSAPICTKSTIPQPGIFIKFSPPVRWELNSYPQPNSAFLAGVISVSWLRGMESMEYSMIKQVFFRDEPQHYRLPDKVTFWRRIAESLPPALSVHVRIGAKHLTPVEISRMTALTPAVKLVTDPRIGERPVVSLFMRNAQNLVVSARLTAAGSLCPWRTRVVFTAGRLSRRCLRPSRSRSSWSRWPRSSPTLPSSSPFRCRSSSICCCFPNNCWRFRSAWSAVTRRARSSSFWSFTG